MLTRVQFIFWKPQAFHYLFYLFIFFALAVASSFCGLDIMIQAQTVSYTAWNSQ